MKNIFKVMGVALLACSMIMVSCKKDDNGEGSGDSQTASLNVTFGSANWNAASNIFLHTSQGSNTLDENYLILYAFKNAEDANNMLGGQSAANPYIDGTLMTVPGSYTNQSSGGDVVSYNDPTDTYYYSGDNNNDPGTYLRWNPISSSFQENITAVDLTARTMSSTFSCEHFDLEQVEANGWTSYGETRVMNGTMNNYGWTWYEDTAK
ncbi:MAG: hypothetical protein J6X59_01335 [Bacteroidales bacterium]|nr:hypothetical protein [Bacteroidales bacterium]